MKKISQVISLSFVLLFIVSCEKDSVINTNSVEFIISGSIEGNSEEITLSLNGSSQTFTGSSFTFTNKVVSGSNYIVEFVSSSSGKNCTVVNGSGIANSNVSDVEIKCLVFFNGIIRYSDVSIIGNMVSGDLNGDQNIDLVFTIRTLNDYPTGGNQYLTRVVFGDGNGGFGKSHDIIGISEPNNTNKRGGLYICTDLNNDNIDDFAYTSDIIEAYSGNTDGQPKPLFNITKYGGEPILTLDADGNGFKDILSITKGGSNLNFFGLFKNNGSALASVSHIGTTLDDDALAGSIPNFSVANFDNNSIQDILAITYVLDSNDDERLALALFSGNGDGSFNYPSSLQILPFNLHVGTFLYDITSKEIASGDFDKDGDIDIAITSTNTIVQILLNDGNGDFVPSEAITVGNTPIHIRVADFNQDSHLDFISVNDKSNNLTIAYGDGKGVFNTTKTIQLDSNVDFYDIIVENIDNNNFPDIALAEQGNSPSGFGRGSIQIVLNPGQ